MECRLYRVGCPTMEVLLQYEVTFNPHVLRYERQVYFWLAEKIDLTGSFGDDVLCSG